MSATTIISSPTVTVTATATVQAVPIYFETCWSILSTLGLFNFVIGFLIIGMIGFSFLALIPMLAGAGAALGCGISYITFYSPDFSTKTKMTTSVIEDLAWLLADFMIPFYSFFIVRMMTRGMERTVHHSVFTLLMSTLVGTRLGVAYERYGLIKSHQNLDHLDPQLQYRINMLHVGSFIAIALSEIWNGYFLIKKFMAAQKRRESFGKAGGSAPFVSGPGTNLYSVLARSTEVRLAVLAFVGIMRCITFPFQAAAQAATNLPSQFDRFATTIEYLVPIVLYIDLLGSKLAFHMNGTNSSNGGSSTGNPRPHWWGAPAAQRPINVTSEIRVEEGRRTSSNGGESSDGTYSDTTKLTFINSTVTSVTNPPAGSRASNVIFSTPSSPTRAAAGREINMY